MRALAVLLTALLLATGCGAPGAVPDAAIPRNDGGNADLHGIAIRNVYLVSGTLYGVLINGGTQADELQSAKVSTAAVTLRSGLTLQPGQPTGADQPLGSVTGVSGQVGSWVPATFQFRDAGSVTAQIPFKDRSG